MAFRMRMLGIDGGGTKTAFTLLDEDMRVLERFELGTCHYAQAGFEGAERVLAEGIARAAATGALGEEWGIGLGICGYGEGADATRRLDNIVRRVCAGRPHVLVNDVEAAWAAGLDLADGIVIIAGTGSIAYGVCRGRSLRVGGWDFELGDEGSAGWLGKELLFAFTRESDGRAPAGAILDLVRAELGLADDFDLIGFAQRHMAERGRIARLAPLVTRAAEAGDACARDILARAAREEAAMVATIVRRIFPADDASRPDEGLGGRDEGPDGRDATIPVTYIGGTFRAGALILDPLARTLPARCRLVAPAHDPALGACLLLRRRMSQEGAVPGEAR